MCVRPVKALCFVTKRGGSLANGRDSVRCVSERRASGGVNGRGSSERRGGGGPGRPRRCPSQCWRSHTDPRLARPTLDWIDRSVPRRLDTPTEAEAAAGGIRSAAGSRPAAVRYTGSSRCCCSRPRCLRRTLEIPQPTFGLVCQFRISNHDPRFIFESRGNNRF